MTEITRSTISVMNWYFANVAASLCECFATTFGQSTLIRERAGTAGRSVENERSFVDNPRRMYPTKRQTRQKEGGWVGEGEGSRGCTRRAGNYVSGRPFVRLQSTTARSWEEPALSFRERDARKKAAGTRKIYIYIECVCVCMYI